METWKKVWRGGVAPQLSDAGLGALRQGLLADDPALLQGATTSPPPLMCVRDWPVEGACPIGYCFWKGDRLETVEEVENAFAQACARMEVALGEPAAVRYFASAWDDMPREEIRPALLAEVELEINRRAALAA